MSSKFPPVTTPDATDRCESYGQQGLTLVDRLGVWLSKRPIERELSAIVERLVPLARSARPG